MGIEPYDFTLAEQDGVKVFASQSPNDLDFGKSPYDFELSGHLRS